VLELATALAGVVAAVGKLALDVELLAQTEVDELSEGGGNEHGGSSALPNKHNPVDAVLVRSAAFRAPGLVSTVLAASQHEHERACGAWHGEWGPLRELLRITGGAVARTRRLLTGLVVKPGRMSANIEASGLLVMAESLATKLSVSLGRTAAQLLVAACCRRAIELKSSLRDIATADDAVRAHMSPSEIDDALRPSALLEAVGILIDRALAGRPS
jgi:3-carboxy-cis,cis-muconate cycloisomerase